jgi:hypothetical protein
MELSDNEVETPGAPSAGFPRVCAEAVGTVSAHSATARIISSRFIAASRPLRIHSRLRPSNE